MEKMSFTIMQHNGTKVIQYFFNIDELIKSMLDNPKDIYHRNM
jgi:membrane-associated HD superfamily phosphohydrolase